MFKIGKYILLGVWLMLSIFVASAQTFDYATPSATAPVNDDANPANDEVEQISSGDKVCPSFLPGAPATDFPSTNNFSVPVTLLEAGDQALNEFVWVVYGGTITAYEGVSLVEAIQTDEVTTGIHRSYVRIKGSNAAGTHSRITVRWDEVDVPNAWVAVQQFSEWNCTEGKWSLFTNPVQNDPPTFSSFPANTILAWGQRLGYILPLPTHDDDGCPDVSLLDQTWIVENPVGTTIASGGDDAVADHTADLQLGVNTVTWAVTDGVNTYSQSYTITVEPELHILNVAWINPSCGNSNGSVRVSNTTDLSLFSVPISYSLSSDGGSTWGAWQADPYFGSLAAGTTYQIQASLLYPSGHRQVSDAYEFTLSAMAANAIDAIPTTAPNATVKRTSCNNVADGIIDIGTTVMNEQNNSVSFDGTDDHFLLNKSLTGVVSQFSVALWVKTTAQNGTLISFDPNEYFQIDFIFGQIQLSSRSTDLSLNTVLVYNTLYAINDGLWHLVLATFDGTTYKIYVDGNQAQSIAGNGSLSIGKVGSTRFGALGAGLVSQNFGGAVSGTRFSGQMAEVGLWNTVVTPENAVAMRRTGMTSVGGMTDHWILNNIPENVATTVPHVAVFSDAGNTVTPANWARYMNSPTLATGNSPKLYSWNDDATQITGKRTGLAVGTYTFNVKDLFGCGTVSQPFVVANGDEAEPYILWNVSPHKATRQFPPVPANTLVGDSLMTSGRAADGWLYSGTQIYYTTADADEALQSWWDVTLGTSTYPINRIRIHPQADLTNFWVLVSPNDFTAGSNLTADLAVAGVYAVEYTGPAIAAGTYYDVMLPANTYGRYVRIRTSNTKQALSLYEVEVLTPYVPATERKLLLTDECVYTFSDNDATATPIPIDDCGNTPTLTHNVGGAPSPNSLNDVFWGKGPQTVTWTVLDENGVSASYDIPYFVADEIKPEFAENPFDGEPTVLTFCDVDPHYTFKIPAVSDNYTCTPLVSISLLRDGTSIYTVPMGSYDSNNPGTVNITEANMPAGTHVYTWRVRDASSNVATISHTYEIDTRPILRDVKVSPITCHNANNGVIYFSDVQAQAGQTVTYILRNVIDNSEITRTDPIFPSGTVPPGTYKAFIEVRGCRAEFAVRDIVFTNPAEITSLNDVTDVECYGQETGAIDIDARGGSQTNILHLMDGGAYATAPNYTQLNLTETGMIEAWIYLDELVDGGTNWNAGIFGLPNSGNGYGLRMVDGNLRFYVSNLYAEMPAVTITHRKWFYVRGTWVGNGTRVLNLEVRDQEGASTSVDADAASLTADFTANSGGNVFIGSLGDGNTDHNLRGFVRNARIWSAPIDATVVEQNLNLTSPIDPNGTLVANYPLNAAGGNTVSNTRYPLQAGSVTGVEGTNFKRQKFAYYWLDPEGNPVAPYPHAEDITNQDAGTYTVTLYDPMGCIQPINIPIITDDKVAPTMTFFTDRTQNTVLAEGDPIIRMTNYVDAASGNLAGDCYYIPHMVTAPAPYLISEFDPRVTDGVCDASYVDVTWELLAGSDPFVDTPADPDLSSLNGRQMQGRMDIRWTATDKNGSPTSRVVTYYIVDNEAPASLTLAPVTVYVDGSCEYVVPAGSTHLIPVLTDNCETGILQNNITGTSTLDGAVLEKRVYNVEWTYTDRILYTGQPAGSITFFHELRVEDNTLPSVECKAIAPVQLNFDGKATIANLDLLGNNAGDNCDEPTYLVTKNVAYGRVATQIDNGTWDCGNGTFGPASNAVDGNRSGVYNECSVTHTNSTDHPWWQVDLSESHTIYQIRVYNRTDCCPERLSDFYVLISDNPIAAAPADWGNPVWPADVKAHYFSGVAGAETVFEIPAETGRYVRIWSTNNEVLSLAEVEVYGTTNPATATTVEVDCDDIRYTPAPDTGTPGVWDDAQGTFGPIGILLSAIDGEGNMASCLQDVVVEDNILPYAVVAPNIQVELDENGSVRILGSMIDGGSTDACGIDTMWVERSDFNCFDEGGQGITLFVRDVNGRIGRRNSNVIIADKTKPVIGLKNDIRVYIGPDGYYDIMPATDFEDASTPGAFSTDNCSDVLIRSFVGSSERVVCGNKGNYTVTYRVSDLLGNFKDSTFVITVMDTLPPRASINKVELVVQTNNVGVLYFDEVISPTSLRDNCDNPVPYKYIKYGDDDWCPAGFEGTATEPAYTNMARFATDINGSTPAVGFPYKNAADGSLANSYVTKDSVGVRSIVYEFAEEMEFNNTIVVWDQRTLSTSGDISTDNGSITFDGLTNSEPGYDATHGLDKLNNGSYNNNNTYVTNSTSASGSILDVVYNFNEKFYVGTTNIYWTGGGFTVGSVTVIRPSQYRVWYLDDNTNTWVAVNNMSNTSNGSNSQTINQITSQIRIQITNTGNQARRLGIQEWVVNGYKPWINIDRPTSSATVSWWNSTTNSWVLQGNINRNAPPTQNSLALNPANRTSKLKLEFNTTAGVLNNRRVGIQEWAVVGRKVWTGGTGPCKSFTCEDVNDTIPVKLMWQDASFNSDSVLVMVPIVPYFRVDSMRIDDCGVSGEVFNFDPINFEFTYLPSYTYSWSTISRPAGTLNQTAPFWNVGGTVKALTSTERNPMVQNSTTGMITGNYEVQLTVTDPNSCSFTRRYPFYWNWANGGGAFSNKYPDVCEGDTITYWATLARPVNGLPYTDSSYTWLYTPTDVTYISGGGTNQNFLKVVFNKGRTSTMIQVNSRASQSGYYPCDEGLRYNITIHPVVKPSFVNPIDDLCPFDTVTYRVSQTFASYGWTYDGGRLLAGGNWNENFATILWNDVSKSPYVKVVGYNLVGCKDSLEVFPNWDMVPPPDLDCDHLNVYHSTNVTSCQWTFSNLGIPIITTDCHDRYQYYENDKTGTMNASGQYPVGVTTVTWKAVDWYGQEGTCSHTVTVIDDQPPYFLQTPSDTTVVASSLSCRHKFVGKYRDVTVDDYCDANDLTATANTKASVFRLNSVSGEYDILVQDNLSSIEDFEFESGISLVRWKTSDGVNNLAYAAWGYSETNEDSIEFFVTVVDKTPPTVADADGATDGIQLTPITATNDADECGATLVVAPPGHAEIDDNCSDFADMTVTFVGRSDAKALADAYPVGPTTIAWRVTDEAGNRTTATQLVTVTDVQAPTFTDATEFTDRSISYCARANYLIPIPRSYSDNCRVMRLDYTVVNESSGSTVFSGSIDGALYPNFNPNGTGFLSAHTFADADAVNGSDYTITWRATDAADLFSDDNTWKYNLHIEMQPHFSEVISTALSCVNNEATITVVTDAVNTATYRYDRNYTPEFKYGDSNWTTATSFTVNTGADRNIQMRVNGCVSPDVVISKIAEAVEYNISTVHTDVVCPEHTNGTVTLSMTGGAAGQLLFNGGAGYLAAEYESSTYGLTLDLTTQGAVEAWVYLESLANATLVSKGTSYGLKLEGSRFVFFVGGDEASASGYDLALKHWYHVSGWWDGAGLNIRIDESATTFKKAGSYTATVNNDPIVIGSGFNGIIREVRIWDAPVLGAINSITLVGTESNLMGYWPLDDGTGGSARNVCSSNGNVALPATGSNGLWNSTQPQPGTYTWTRTHEDNTTTFSTYGKSNINLTGLSMGTYTATFMDPWDCPAKTSTFKTIKATDNELPVVDLSVVSTTQLMVDENECTYTFTSPSVGGDVDRYTPSISDVSNCNYTTEWRIVNEATGIREHILTGDQTTDLKLFGGRVRKVGTNGNNTVVLTISQNGMSEEITYTIVANDDQRPTAVGKFDDVLSLELSNDLYGNGNVTLLAKDFNNGSSDNCTTDPEKFNPKLASPTPEQIDLGTFDPTDPSDPLWQDDAIFNCSMIGNSVQLYFQVTDESGNSNYATKAVSFNIIDKHKPVFLKNSGPGPTECATFNATGGVPAYHQFETGNPKMILLPEDYTDNCGVQTIQFRLKSLGYASAYYNGDDYFFTAQSGTFATDASVDNTGAAIPYYEGKTEVYFILDDGYGNTKEQLVYTVTILPKPIPGGGAQPGIQ